MEYSSILNRIEEQKKDENLSAKLFRYTGLMQAIEFFSQKLNFDQITDAAFDFVNELLTLEKSAIFVLKGNNYALKKTKGINCDISSIKNSKALQNLAILHGSLVYDEEHLGRIFDKSVIEGFHVTLSIPLIIENSLFGFIFISNKTVGDLNSDDLIISEALMKLFNNALENYKRYEELQKTNSELDEKIFNLFAINQSSKALLSELSLGVLYNLSVDVFSELTQSSITGFVLYDEKSEEYELKAYKDIFNPDLDVELYLSLNKSTKIDPNKIIISADEEADVQYFNSIFNESISWIQELRPLYIVMLIRNSKVLGFVTLGNTVTGMKYKNSMFELIESLASSTYIALSNAQLFKQVSDQKKLIQNKFDKLVSLNNLMKNINSSKRLDTLLEMTLKTLNISFDVDKGLIALYDKENKIFKISNTINIETEKRSMSVTPQWKKVFEGDSIYEATEIGTLNYVDEELLMDIGTSSGILIVPICIDSVDLDILGAIVVFKFKKTLITDEESRVIVETISSHIAPVLSNLFTIEEQKRFSLPNHIEYFKRDLKTRVNQALEDETGLQVIQVMDKRDYIFKGSTIVDRLRSSFERVYPFTNNNIFIIEDVRGESDKEILKKIKGIAGIEDIIIRNLVLGKDFKSFQEFFKLF